MEEPTVYHSNNFPSKKIIIILGSVLIFIVVIVFSLLVFYPHLLPGNPAGFNKKGGPNIETQNQIWKDYQTQSGFEIKVPADFEVVTEEATSSASGGFFTDLLITSADKEAGQFSIAYPVSKNISSKFSKGLDSISDIHPDVKKNLAKSEVIETEVAGKKAKVLLLVNQPTPPAGFEDSTWCNCTSKYVYIDLGEEGILPIVISYKNDKANLGETFDKILATLRL